MILFRQQSENDIWCVIQLVVFYYAIISNSLKKKRIYTKLLRQMSLKSFLKSP